MTKIKKDHLPKIGDKLYYRAEHGKQIHEATCYGIEKREGLQTSYYTTPPKYHVRGFINECDLLDPFSKQVQNFIHREFRKYQKQFNTEWDKYVAEKGGGAITVNIKDLARHFFEFGLNVR